MLGRFLSDRREFCDREAAPLRTVSADRGDRAPEDQGGSAAQSNGLQSSASTGTLFDEHLRVKRRTTQYESVEEMQADLDAYPETYHRNRPHRARGMEGGRHRTSVFKKGIQKPTEPEEIN